MTALAPFVLVLPIVGGGLLAHLLWPDRRPQSIMLKTFLGIGIGLGAQSLLYFAYLLIFAGQRRFVIVELVGFLAVAVLAVRREVRAVRPPALVRPQRPWRPSTTTLMVVAGAVGLLGLTGISKYLVQHREGDWDAWMIYNRTARFLYFDQTHWLESFSPRMDFIFHADYPLMLATNVSAGWELLGTDAAAVPMELSAVFAIGCAGVLVGSLACTKTTGQGALALIMLWGIPAFVNEGAREMADVPLALYMLATASLLLLYVQRASPGLLTLAIGMRKKQQQPLKTQFPGLPRR